jgi:glycosyltransferase involved in cell wall biosynthesis
MGPKVISARLLIHATNVHQGGGKSLLAALLAAIPGDVKALAQLDSRIALQGDLPENLMLRFVPPSVRRRLQAEWWLVQNAQHHDIIICFGNLPPLFKLRGRVMVFVQNRYLVDDVKLNGFPLKTRLRLGLERFWLTGKMANADEFIVQTPSMKRLLDARTRVPVRVLPFMANHNEYVRKILMPEMQAESKLEFVFVASGEPHKNHRQLVEAWCLLAEQGYSPLLKLTLDRNHFPELCLWIEQRIERYRLNIVNVGNLPHAQVKTLYAEADALIYPSTFESFGLPLIEARQAGLPILASELDYVRDVIDPEQTFDPESAVSIARAVKRFLGIEEQPLPLQDASGFLKQIIGRTE